MNHWDAIKASKRGLAARPYYDPRDMPRPEYGKYVVLTARHFTYLIWADNLRYVDGHNEVDPAKCRGYSDWEPIENLKPACRN